MSATRATSAERYPARAGRATSTATRRSVTEMDALVAYLQMLGTLVDFEAARRPQETRQMTYEALRHFADSYGLAAMAVALAPALRLGRCARARRTAAGTPRRLILEDGDDG